MKRGVPLAFAVLPVQRTWVFLCVWVGGRERDTSTISAPLTGLRSYSTPEEELDQLMLTVHRRLPPEAARSAASAAAPRDADYQAVELSLESLGAAAGLLHATTSARLLRFRFYSCN
ncbi:hypothetical protein cyc_03307 [Cyclospora cayetanensis]|uniref:Uncharacterized protein n=1 Tax=Cyclospora cayetanensis TaxID=88456 RepID=A0A1D3D4V0_9EIME|nr:hypothetical protein cyc_03307 [Cyclospora cayetanensis]